jgi:hypothetical protein
LSTENPQSTSNGGARDAELSCERFFAKRIADPHPLRADELHHLVSDMRLKPAWILEAVRSGLCAPIPSCPRM